MAKDQWSESEKGSTGRSRTNELLKSVKKKKHVYRQSAGNATRETLQRVHECYECVDYRMSSSYEKWIENVKHRVFYIYIYMQRRTMWSNDLWFLFFFFSIFLVLKILVLPTYVTATLVYDITFTCTLSVASMETWACVSIVSSSRGARASRTYRSVSMNKRTKTRRCQK